MTNSANPDWIPDCNPCLKIPRLDSSLAQTVIDYSLEVEEKQYVASRPDCKVQTVLLLFTVWNFQPNNNVLSPDCKTGKYPSIKRVRDTRLRCVITRFKKGGARMRVPPTKIIIILIQRTGDGDSLPGQLTATPPTPNLLEKRHG